MLIKKYGNRRLYDTEQSRYITLEELAELIQAGKDDDVRVISADDGEDLTTATLTQIIVEGRGAARLLPVPLLIELIRRGDTALAEVLGNYVTWACQVYLETKKGMLAMTPLAPWLGATGFTRALGLLGIPAPPPRPPERCPSAPHPGSTPAPRPPARKGSRRRAKRRR